MFTEPQRAQRAAERQLARHSRTRVAHFSCSCPDTTITEGDTFHANHGTPGPIAFRFT